MQEEAKDSQQPTTPPGSPPGEPSHPRAGEASPGPAPAREFSLQAALAAWLWPGLGHIVIGQRRRGVLIMFGVLFLFFCGILVGGLDAVDRREDRLWFYAQGLCGPVAFAADFANQNFIKQMPEEKRLHATGLASVSEFGTLFVALAGLMNLVVILDALHFAPKPAEPLKAPPPRRRAHDQRGGRAPEGEA